ncbi:hypothetical protein [Paeniglutamicibacter cryotolerans]|uniref:HutD family protein n=1 Tax=Paeniglutamicibacter cryotolerans TaxID=670079 RepID=A0A839QMC1_9MICC|nr:hypothetical protein [Paeniglutamicibacter cryotolerans]MBB2994352.1 hypothetical protein [Paeniglutamicibacter cryotolerans]
MWLLVRAGSLDGYWDDEQGLRTLAACPDTDERGDPWRWTAQLDERTESSKVLINADPEFIAVSTDIYADGHSEVVERASGTQTVIAVLFGQALVAAVDGPWERWLHPGDVFIVEGEDDEKLRVSLDGPTSRVSVTTLVPRHAAALRWVP